MKKLANLFLMLALLGLPIACGNADFEVPPVTENPNPPANPNPPPFGPVDTPDIQAVETPEVCPVDEPDCGDNDHPPIGPDLPTDYGKVGDRPQVQAVDPSLTQINPCLEDPEAEGCE